MRSRSMERPALLSTWSFGAIANDAGWPVLESGGGALDAVEAAVRAVEADPGVDSVGHGGLPDAAGEVTLDAMVMVSPEQCGGVAGIRDYLHPVSIARRVMERTVHKLLVGPDADGFAKREGFESADRLLTGEAREIWRRWREDPARLTDDRYRGWLPPRNVEELRGVESDHSDSPATHDTIVTLALDGRGVLAGAASTSGMAFKIPGRVGDAPIVGHGLYVDPRWGAAAATGTGELFMGVCGAFLAVERLRGGDSPADAARAVVERIAEQFTLHDDHQAAIVTLTPEGRWSSAALRPGFRVAVRDASRAAVLGSDSVLLPD